MQYEKLDQSSNVALPSSSRREWDAKGLSSDETPSFLIGFLSQKKFWLAIIVVLIILFIIVVSSRTFSPSSPTPDLTSLAPPPTASELLAGTDIQNLKTELETLHQSNIDLNGLVGNLTSQLEQILNNMTSLENTLQSVKQNYFGLEEQFNQLSETVSENSARFIDPPALNPEDKLLLDKASALSVLPSNTPSFRLISVESWDGKPAATLELDGHTNVVHEGEFVANWKILSINTLRRSIQVAPKHDITNLTNLEVGQ